MSQFGNFNSFCRDSTLPACNLFALHFDTNTQFGLDKTCLLEGFAVGDGRVRNLGSVLLCGLAVVVSGLLCWLAERKKAAVGRREMQLFLVSYAIMSIAEIFSVGGFLTNREILTAFSAVHIGMVAATSWLLLVNAIVGYQQIEDGTVLSLGMAAGSALAVFIGVGYVALDTGFQYTHNFPVDGTTLKNIPLYVLYLLFPLVLIVAYFVLESILELGVLGETRPMVLLSLSGFLFIVSQLFNFVISVHLCKATDGKIDGALFETLFVLLAVTTLYFFWSSITEDEWPDETGTSLMAEPDYGTAPYSRSNMGGV